MKDNMEKAVEMLKTGGYTCVICKDDCTYTSKERGIKPLVEWYDSGIDFEGAFAADKVVGKAAAMMYILMKAEKVFSYVMSKGAVETFERFGVQWYCDSVAEVIKNRTETGTCPMEQAVSSCAEPKEACAAVKRKLIELGSK